PPAEVVVRIIREARRRGVGLDDPARALEEPKRLTRIVADPLAVDLIGVLANREVVGPLHPGQMHVDLHLRVMLGPRLLHALPLQLLEALRVRRLELEHVPLRRLAEAAPGTVERPAEVPPVVAHLELPPGRLVDLVHFDTDRPQVSDQPRFLSVPGIEEPEHTTVEARRARPSELVPEGPLARLADLRRAEVRASPVAAHPLVVLVYRENGRGRGRRDR